MTETIKNLDLLNICKYPSLSYVAVQEQKDIATIQIICLLSQLEKRYPGILDSKGKMFEQDLLKQAKNNKKYGLDTLKLACESNIWLNVQYQLLQLN